MPIETLLIVAAITGAFTVFALAVSWADHQSKVARESFGA